MARDFQKNRVYDAEDTIIRRRGTMSLVEVDEFLHSIIRSKWWKNRYPHVTSFHIKDGRGTTWAWGYRRGAVAWLNLPRWARQPLIVLHELAHAIIEHPIPIYDPPAHGREFCFTLLQLVKQFVGRDGWMKLRTAFQAHKVKFVLTPRCVPIPGGKKKVS